MDFLRKTRESTSWLCSLEGPQTLSNKIHTSETVLSSPMVAASTGQFWW